MFQLILTNPSAFKLEVIVPVRKLRKVVLPDPLGPSIAVTFDSGNKTVIG